MINSCNYKKIPRLVFNTIYKILFFYFVADCVLMSDGHYFELFNVYTITITPRLFVFFLLLVFYFIKFLFDKKTRVGPPQACFFFLFVYCSFSFLLGSILNGFDKSWVDYRSVMLLLVVLPIIDVFESGMVKFKTIYRFITVLCFVISIFVLVIYFYQLSNGYSYSYMTWVFGKTQNKFSGFMNLSFRQGAGVYHDALFYVTIISSSNLFILFDKRIKKIIKVLYAVSTIIMVAAIAQSVTKGFYIYFIGCALFIAIANAIKYMQNKKMHGERLFSSSFVVLISLVFAALTTITFLLLRYVNIQRLFDFDSESTKIRITFIKEAMSNIFKPTFFIGKMYGFHLPSKGEIHLEISLLEVLLKQGFIGLILWIAPFLFIIRVLVKMGNLDKISKSILINFLVSVYVISLFNPHLCSVSGILVVSLSIGGAYCEGRLSFNKSDVQRIALITVNENGLISIFDTNGSLAFCIDYDVDPKTFACLLISKGYSHMIYLESMHLEYFDSLIGKVVNGVAFLKHRIFFINRIGIKNVKKDLRREYAIVNLRYLMCFDNRIKMNCMKTHKCFITILFNNFLFYDFVDCTNISMKTIMTNNIFKDISAQCIKYGNNFISCLYLIFELIKNKQFHIKDLLGEKSKLFTRVKINEKQV